MARARNIKPGFYKNADLAECSYPARLVFPGLWMLADRCGRLQDRPKQIKGELLPHDQENMDALLDELARNSFILRYAVEGKRYIQILNFEKHQHPHVKEPPSTIPAPDNNCSCPVQKRLTPDSLLLIPDTGLRIPDTGSPMPPSEAIAIAPAKDLLDEPLPRINGAIPDCPYQAIATAYHEALPELPRLIKLSKARKDALKARWTEVCVEDHLDSEGALRFFRDFFQRVKRSDWLMGRIPGRGGEPFKLNFDWMFKQANFLKIAEGNYHRGKK